METSEIQLVDVPMFGEGFGGSYEVQNFLKDFKYV